MATHSNTLAWKISWMEEPGRLQSMGLQRVRHDWSDLAAAAAWHVVVIVQLLSRVWLFVTQWTAVCLAFLSFTISQSLLKFMSIELVILCNQLILYCPLSSCPQIFPSITIFSNDRSFPMSELFTSGGQSIGASTSVLPVNKKCWFPLLTNLVSLLSKGLSRVFCNTAVQSINSLVLSLI